MDPILFNRRRIVRHSSLRRFLSRWWKLYTRPPGSFVDVVVEPDDRSFTMWYRFGGRQKQHWGPFASEDEMWDMFLLASKDLNERIGRASAEPRGD